MSAEVLVAVGPLALSTIGMDEREGLPSASNMERIASCPGSENLIKNTPKIRLKEHDRYAAGGNRIHFALAATSEAELHDRMYRLNEFETKTAHKCMEHLVAIRKQVFGSETNDTKAILEKRIWLVVDGKKVCSGKADRVEVVDQKAIIVDYKSLYGDVEDAPDNKQLMTLAVLWFNELGGLVDEIWVAIIQPLVTDHPILCRYTREDLLRADAQLMAYLSEAKQPDAPRRAGDWCTYCPAKPHCPEARAAIGALVPNGNATIMSPEDLGKFLDVCKQAEKIIKSAKERAEELILAGVEVPGWELKPGNEVRRITDPKEAYKALNAAKKINLDAFLKLVNVPIGDLEEAIRRYSGCTAIEAKAAVNSICLEWIEKKKNKPSLKQTK